MIPTISCFHKAMNKTMKQARHQAQPQQHPQTHGPQSTSISPSREEVLNYLGKLADDYHLPENWCMLSPTRRAGST